jgi:hypothetical protein
MVMGFFIFLPSILKELAHSVNLKKMYKYFYKVLYWPRFQASTELA